MKPLDEEWVREGPHVVSQTRADAGYERVVGRAASYRDADMFAAAPDMAQRLLAGLENGHRRDCPRSLRLYRAIAEPCTDNCTADRAALAKAGVLVP